jgi:hypothetical protein
MGLDLTVSLESNKDHDEVLLETMKTITNGMTDIEYLYSGDKYISTYYRLNWGGVTAERIFSFILLSFALLSKEEKQKRKITLKQARKLKDGVVIVTGISKWYYGLTEVEKIVTTKSLKKGKGNIIKLKGYSCRENTYVSKYNIYKIDNMKRFPSVLSFISLGTWGGSNGEVSILRHGLIEGEKALILFENKYIAQTEEQISNNEDPDTEEVMTETNLTGEQLQKYTDQVNDYIETLEKYLSTGRDVYIAKNNLSILYMIQALIRNEQMCLVSVFG